MKTRHFLAMSLLALLVLAPAATAGQQPERNNGADYRIGSGDVLEIAVWNNTALSRTVPVRPDGKISLPVLQDVQAAGYTPMELRNILSKKLTAYVANPEVSVIVREVHSFAVSVLGEVKTPGRYELKGRPTVLDALALAGPFSDFAARSRIVIIRNEEGKSKQIPFNYNKAVSGGNENVFLRPGDVIVVP
jgi:polysaccharide export outer membrane protein